MILMRALQEKPYSSPQCEMSVSLCPSLLCGSMVDAGGTEDLVYVDWSDLIES